MDILSTGEKIKRTRIYKGLTLKDLCSDDISVSKLSCIENGKVKADSKMLEIIAKRLDIDLNYLLLDSKEQLCKNLEKLKKKSINDSDYEEIALANLNNSKHNGYINLALEFNHLLFEAALSKNEEENISNYIIESYRLYQRSNDKENILLYYNDFAKYLLRKGEYSEAITYYQNIIGTIILKPKEAKEELLKNEYYLSYCLYKTGKVEAAYSMILDVVENGNKVKKILKLAEIYSTYSVLCILNKIEKTEYIIKKTMKIIGNDKGTIAKLMLDYGIAYFKIEQNEKAISNIKAGISNYPKDNKEEYVDFLKSCIDVLYTNKEYSEAYNLTDEALNYAIENNNMKDIEKIYYYKGSCLQKAGNYRQAEIYLNLSLDSLFKCGSMDDRYSRYMNLGELYYNLNEIKEAIKYFGLANEIYKHR